MSYELTIPFQAFELKMNGGNIISIPLNDLDHGHINTDLKTLAKRYEEQFQNAILNKGDAVDILEELPFTAPQSRIISIPFPEAKNGYSYPDFSIDFKLFYSNTSKGIMGYIPAIAMQFFAHDEDEVEDVAEKTVRLEFSKSKRLRTVHSIVSALWYESIQLIESQIKSNFLRPSEIDSIERTESNSLLQRVGVKLSIKEKVSFFRSKEVKQIANILGGKFLKNVLLVGPSGVGKTALFHELVFQAKNLNVEQNIRETSASILIKELTGETGWQDAISTLAQELNKAGEILFVRNLYELFEVGQYEGNNISVAEYLKLFLSRGELIILSECTQDELNKIELKQPNYSNLFHIIKLNPPKNLEDAIAQKVKQLADQKVLKLEPEAITECIRVFKRFNPYSGFPGKPIRFLEGLINNKSVEYQQFPRVIDSNEVIEQFCLESGMPQFIVDPKIEMNPSGVHRFFDERIFGQKRAVKQVANVIATVKTGLNRPDKPISSFLFVGPTGVGKTEMAKSLAKFMFNNEAKMMRFDMSEYSDLYGVSRLIGLGGQRDGTLHRAVRRNPFGVLLFDEIEKAHPDFFDLLLQILSEGRLTDSNGKLVNFCSIIIIMTSNIGAAKFQQDQIGWSSSNTNRSIADQYKSEVEKHFRPELFNRIDQIIPFEPLTKASMKYIVDRELDLLMKREGIKYRNVELVISSGAKEYLAEKGYDKKFGARYLQKAIHDNLVSPLAKTLNQFDHTQSLKIKIGTKNKELNISSTRIDEQGEDYIEILERLILTDLVSELRRKIHQLQEGQAFIGLVNKWSESKANDEVNFENKSKNRDLEQLESDMSQLMEEVENVEEKLSMYSLDYLSYDKKWEIEIETWKERFGEFQKSLYLNTYPEETKGIYFYLLGTDDLSNFIHLYLELFNMNQFEFEVESMWYEKSHFEEAKKEKQFPYTLQIEKDLRNYVPFHKAENHLFCGLRFTIKSGLSRLFLMEEIGVHHWNPKADEVYKTSIEIYSIGEDLVSNNCHKKDFLKGDKPRRISGPDYIKDNVLVGTALPIQISITEQIDFIQNSLEETFIAKLEAAIA